MRLRPAALLAAVVGVFILLSPATALATPTPTPTPSATATAGEIPEQNPIVEGQNITVTLRDLKGGEGEPETIPGVTLTVYADSKDGSLIGTQVTDQQGRVSIAIPSNGVYVVVLDPDTLPAEVSS